MMWPYVAGFFLAIVAFFASMGLVVSCALHMLGVDAHWGPCAMLCLVFKLLLVRVDVSTW